MIPVMRQGPKVAGFEQALAARVGAGHGMAVSSGTAALYLPFFPRTVPLLVGTAQIRDAALTAGHRSVRVLKPSVDATTDHPAVDPGGFRAEHGLDPEVPLVVTVCRLVPDLKRVRRRVQRLRGTTPTDAANARPVPVSRRGVAGHSDEPPRPGATGHERKLPVTDIPLVDLKAQHEQVADEVAAGWTEVLKAEAFIGGPQVSAFEAEIAGYTGVEHAAAEQLSLPIFPEITPAQQERVVTVLAEALR